MVIHCLPEIERAFLILCRPSRFWIIFTISMADAKTSVVPPESAPLTDEQKEALEKLKTEFPDKVLDEVMLIRFIRGYWTEADRHNHTVAKLKATFVGS